ncbi:MAG: hypothetical protein QGH83_16070 [Candidatus Pacebacteria bacterium]|nr:hypothetical protein [Candidatus Paceibacterota bacterium]
MASLEGNELYKYAYRVEVFVKKLEEKSKFKIVNKGEVELVPQKSIIKHIKDGKPTRNVILIDTDGNEYKFNQIEKTKEFGGKGAGAGTAKEDAELTSLKEQLEEAKKTEKSHFINLKVKNKIHKVSFAVTTPGGPKSDFHLVDNDGNEVVWISHKDGSTAKGFQQWGGISQKIEPTIFRHIEVQQFINDLKSDYPDGLSRATTLYRHIADKTLKMMSVYGNQFPTRREDRQNCSILLQGPVKLKKFGANYQLSANHVHYNGDSVDGQGFDPVLMAIYKGDRNDAGVKGTRIVISPVGGRKGKEYAR